MLWSLELLFVSWHCEASKDWQHYVRGLRGCISALRRSQFIGLRAECSSSWLIERSLMSKESYLGATLRWFVHLFPQRGADLRSLARDPHAASRALRTGPGLSHTGLERPFALLFRMGLSENTIIQSQEKAPPLRRASSNVQGGSFVPLGIAGA